MNKRGFLKLTTAGVAAAIVPSTLSQAAINSSGTNNRKTGVLSRTLGNTGLKVPIVGAGILPVENINLCRKIFASGINHIDSAWEYHAGRNDEMVGKMLKEFGRKKYTISTKVLLPQDEKTGQYTADATYDAFMTQLDLTLSRLATDYVDILYLHKPLSRAAALNENMLKGLRKAKESGLARHIGLSTHSNQVELIDAAIESNFYEVVLAGYNYRADAIVRPAIERAASAGLGIVAMKVFAGVNSEVYWESDQSNKPAALKWVLNDPNVATAIVTFRSFEELELLTPMLKDISISEQEKGILETARRQQGIYCVGCQTCKNQCPHQQPIPDMMRAYMYAYGYKNPLKARKTLVRINASDAPCQLCNECIVDCPEKFDIKNKIIDIARITQIPEDFLVG